MTVQPGFDMGSVNFVPDQFNVDQKGNGMAATNFAPDQFNNSLAGQLRADHYTIGQEPPDLRHRRFAMFIKRSTAKSIRIFVRASDTRLGLPGVAASIVVAICKTGLTSYATITPVITDLGNGEYDVALTASHTDTFGLNALRFTCPNALPIEDFIIQVVAFDPEDSVRAGLTALPNAAAEAAGGLYTRGAGAGQINQSNAGRVDVDVQGSTITSSADITKIGGSAPAAANFKAMFDGSGYVDVNAPSTQGGLSSAQTAINAHTDAVGVTVNAHTDAVGATILAAIPSAATIRDAVLDAARSGHLGVGTIGEGIALAASLLQGNFMVDNVDNTDANGPIAQRLRCWVSAAAMAGATPGGVGAQGAFAVFAVTTTYVGPNKIATHTVVQQ